MRMFLRAGKFYSISHIITAILVFACLFGCSREKPTRSLPGAHPEMWMDQSSPDFHGNVALYGGLQSCAVCHGGDWSGGKVEVSCIECHRASPDICISCHGGLDNTSGAPPYGLGGEAYDTSMSVGAHTAHLDVIGLTSQITCDICHYVPLFMMDSLHLDLAVATTGQPIDSIAELTWGDLAGDQSAWNRNQGSCTQTYCHGNFSGGNTSNTPVWNAADQALCGSCHDAGIVPSSLGGAHKLHITDFGLRCADCHSGVVDTLLNIVNLSLHVNGVVDTLERDSEICSACHGSGPSACNMCHGGVDNQTGAPPEGLEGELLTSQLAVGAHTGHVESGLVADAFYCTECHITPTKMLDPGHLGADSIAELTWGDLAGDQSVWNRSAGSCGQTYCHGNFAGGKTDNTPVWTAEDQALCGSCHDAGIDPSSLGGVHGVHVISFGFRCADCHAGVVDTLLNINNLSLHVNGVADTLERDPEICSVCHEGGESSCSMCHGGVDNQTGAPPEGLEGELLTSQLAVGAHTGHVEAGPVADAFNCTECHITPIKMLDPGHLGTDSIAELTWGDLAGDQSVWSRSEGSCAQTYCHGNFIGGNTSNTPVWTSTDQALCGSCHDAGIDPSNLGGAHKLHVTDFGLRCADCHSGVVDTLLIVTNLALHVNGVADTLERDPEICSACHGSGPGACNMCHGGVDNQTGAPPEGLEGELLPSQLAVGAHTGHVEAGLVADAFYCTECHITPTRMLDPGHLGADSVAELTWGELAGDQSVWNRSAGSCGQTYCHGNFVGGNTSNIPVWTAEDQAWCGSCHDAGVDPSSLGDVHAVHVLTFGLKCADCHSEVVDTLLNITDLALHVNGVVDTLERDHELCAVCHEGGQSSCSMCHGGVDNQTGAPPEGLEGELLTSQLAVGAHTGHVVAGTVADAFYCTECHITPTKMLDPGHLGADSVAELTWGDLAGDQSVWNRSTGSCGQTYCHGNFDGGNTSNTPVWTAEDQALCGSCHDAGVDPSSLGDVHAVHVLTFGFKCADCHSEVVDTLLNIIDLALHVNGVADTLERDPEICSVCHDGGETSCSICHGGVDNQTGAPPEGLEGELLTNQLAVGAHTGHVEAGTIADAFNCTECHITPTKMLDPGHLGADSIAELTWGDLAGDQSVWNRSAGSCGQTYCHGNFDGGNTSNIPVWTAEDQALCGSCHDAGVDPSSLGGIHGAHVLTFGLKCADCHSEVVDTLLNITDLALHVNGVVDTLERDPELCSVCHEGGETSCSICHGGVDNQTGAPPEGLEGELLPSQLAVGAHTGHVEAGQVADAFNCTECHITPVKMLDPGHLGADSIAELTWGDLAGDQSVWNRSAGTCGQTYCHGNFVGGKTSNIPVWTAEDQALCGSCHDAGVDPSSLGGIHGAHVLTFGLKCADCHWGVVDTLLNVTDLTLHVNGVADTLERDPDNCNICHDGGTASCSICHGGVDNQTGAPPQGLEGELLISQLAVGAHTGHVEAGLVADAFYCTECHITPTKMLDPGHLGADSIAELTWGDLAGDQSVWNRSAGSCAQTYCHGNFTGGKTSNTPVWNAEDQALCGSCHDAGVDPSSLGGVHGVHVITFGLKCADCHSEVVDTLLNVTNLTLHVNGVVDTLERDPDNCNICHDGGTASCSICHGGVDNQTGAPPEGLEGEMLTTQLAVGAHTGHVEAGPIADAFYCTECHITPINMLDPGHLGADSIAELTWSDLAGNQSVWDRSTGSCAQTYCHGNFFGGNASNTPVWTASNQSNCGSCHDVGSDPDALEGKHRKHVEIKDLPCNRCHSTTTDIYLNITGPNIHVDGQNQVSFSTGQGTYLDGTCSDLEAECHDTRSWYTPLRHRP